MDLLKKKMFIFNHLTTVTSITKIFYYFLRMTYLVSHQAISAQNSQIWTNISKPKKYN